MNCSKLHVAERGYMLVGCDSNGVNVFFADSDAVVGAIAWASARDACYPHAVRTQRPEIEEKALGVAKLSLFEA